MPVVFVPSVDLKINITLRVRRRALTLRRGRAIHARLDPLVRRIIASSSFFEASYIF